MALLTRVVSPDSRRRLRAAGRRLLQRFRWIEHGIRQVLPTRLRYKIKHGFRRGGSILRGVQGVAPLPALQPVVPAAETPITLTVASSDAGLRARLASIVDSEWLRIVDPADYHPGPDDYVFAPQGVEYPELGRDLRSIYLALCAERPDVLVVSRCLESSPVVSVASRRDNVIVRGSYWNCLTAEAPLPPRLRGRTLRLLASGQPAGRNTTLPELLGVECACHYQEFATGAAFHLPAQPANTQPALPLDPAPTDATRPLVLVMPGVFAMGGVERNTVEVLRRLQDRYRFVLATTVPHDAKRGALHHQAAGLCEAIYDLGEMAPASRHLELLEKLHARYSFDCVWIVNGSIWLRDNLASVREVFAGVPIVDQQVYDTEHGWISCYRDPAIQSFDRHVAINSRIAAAFEHRFGIAADRIRLVYHAIDSDKWERVANGQFASGQNDSALRLAWGIGADEPVYGFIGRITEQKQPLDFLDIARRARDEGLPGVFVMVGDGQLAAACRDYVRTHGLSNVRLPGFLDDPSGLFAMLSGLVITSAYEGLPIVSLEAMACGVPVLATDVGDLRLVCERHQCGAFFADGSDAAARYASFKGWLGAFAEHKTRARKAAAGIRAAFHAQVIANQYAQVFQELLDARPRLAVRPLAIAGHASVSVVIPTYNRREKLAAVLARYAEVAQGLDYELIVIDDGSTDGTAELLETLASQQPRLLYQSVPNGGPGQARNVGAAMAVKQVVLFVGDDIVPCDDRFVRTHARLHACHAGEDFAVLGKVVWPTDGSIPITAVMRQIQGKTGEQFGYAHLRPCSRLDWRFFYTCNVSVKRTLVADWRRDGFSADFTAAAFEDAEFAYRMFQRPGGLQIYYDPASVGAHHHVHTVRTFMDRQFAVGEMAAVLLDKHPEAAGVLSLDCLIQTMEQANGARRSHVGELLSVIEGIKAFAVLLEERGAVGDSHWHQAFLGAVFELVVRQGFIVRRSTGATATDAAYESILALFIRRIEPIVDIELPGFRGLLDNFKAKLQAAA